MTPLLFIFQTDIFLPDHAKGIGKSIVEVDCRVLPWWRPSIHESLFLAVPQSVRDRRSVYVTFTDLFTI